MTSLTSRRTEDFVGQLPDEFAGQRPKGEKQEDDEDDQDHTDDDGPLEVTPDYVAKRCPWRGEPEERRLRSARKSDSSMRERREGATDLGSSSGCGASRALPTGFFSASSPETSENSASTFPLKKKKKNGSIASRVHEPRADLYPGSLLPSTARSLATNLENERR